MCFKYFKNRRELKEAEEKAFEARVIKAFMEDEANIGISIPHKHSSSEQYRYNLVEYFNFRLADYWGVWDFPFEGNTYSIASASRYTCEITKNVCNSADCRKCVVRAKFESAPIQVDLNE
jgi:methionine synthase II (cobalamin-independent)